ncbi:hypothetical protein ABZ379_47755 [Streptomyces canus]|uniref:hypothetical protein n=1 Tax=Streptomyces canus TaxID=58343 RepID=UPI00340616B8
MADDLERNLNEQDRISKEIEALQTKLRDLQRDHTVLVTIQEALGLRETSAARHDATQVPATRRSRAAGDAPASTRKGTKDVSQPTLVSLVRAYLTSQKQPCSAAEVTIALSRHHPEQTVKGTVVRTTLEGLVAKAVVHRSKQGASVFYTVHSAPEATLDERGPATDSQQLTDRQGSRYRA